MCCRYRRVYAGPAARAAGALKLPALEPREHSGAHRALRVARGTRAVTAQAAAEAAVGQTLHVGEASGPWISVTRGGLRRWLGGAVDTVVLDLHDGLDLDALGRASGLIRGGGRLILRLPLDAPRRGELAVWPFEASDVGVRSWHRLEAMLADPPQPQAAPVVSPASDAEVLPALQATLNDVPGPMQVVLGRRGRGKSTLLGRVLSGREGIVLTGPSPQAVAQVRAMLGVDAPPWTPPVQALSMPGQVLVVDEAAQLPVALLHGLARSWSERHRLMATTTDGYEGTGQGFRLRFLTQHSGAVRHHLTVPRRWAPCDPVEAAVDHLLLARARPVEPGDGPWSPEVLLREQLTEERLSQVVGLLRHAHYRTTPADLQRLLDAPNLTLHGLVGGRGVVAVNLVAHEGGLSAEQITAIQERGRIRGHALPDTLVCHGGVAAAGAVRWARSVRIAVHPALRRRGLASVLTRSAQVAHPDHVFGTLFSADAGVIAFRRSLGYRVVRLGVAASARTGGVAVVMVRPTPETSALVERLRGDLARDLPALEARLRADLGLALDEAALAAVRERLPSPRPLPAAELRAVVRAVVAGPRPVDTAPVALRSWLLEQSLDVLTPEERALVCARLLENRSWVYAAQVGGLAAPHHAQKALKRTLRRLLPD